MTEISQSCIDVSISLAPVGSTGGLLNALDDQVGVLTDLNDLSLSPPPTNPVTSSQKRYVAEYSINRKCIQGSAFDQLFG